jgi:competence ComEA-like helix-hairpin-helix protein
MTPLPTRSEPAGACDAPAAHVVALSLLALLLAGWAALGQWARWRVPAAPACALHLSAEDHRWRCVTAADAPRGPSDRPDALPPHVAFAVGQPIDLNAASREDLLRLDGLGPAKADAILALRADLGGLCDLSELAQAPGIGPQTVARWSPWLAVNRAHAPRRCGL